MFNLRVITGFLVVFALFFCLSPLAAQELQQTFSHSIKVGSPAASFEHRIDLPEKWAAEGKFFIGRALTLDGKMVIEREELTRTFYYVKVRLPKATLWFAKGSIDITLKAGDALTSPATSAPTSLKASGDSYPRFSWAGTGSYSAISLLDRSSGKTLWERVILDNHACEMDEGSVKVGGRYSWAVKQSDETARYSSEAQAQFRVDTRQERCRQCFGAGYVTCKSCNGSGHIVTNGPNNTPVTKVCYTCNGTGRERCQFCLGQGHVTVPIIIQE